MDLHVAASEDNVGIQEPLSFRVSHTALGMEHGSITKTRSHLAVSEDATGFPIWSSHSSDNLVSPHDSPQYSARSSFCQSGSSFSPVSPSNYILPTQAQTTLGYVSTPFSSPPHLQQDSAYEKLESGGIDDTHISRPSSTRTSVAACSEMTLASSSGDCSVDGGVRLAGGPPGSNRSSNQTPYGYDPNTPLGRKLPPQYWSLSRSD